MHAPLLTPEKRASVSSATSFPQLRCFSAEVTWQISSMSVPNGLPQISTITSPGSKQALGAAALNRLYCRPLAGEHARPPVFTVHAIGIDDAGIDCGTFDDGSIGREVAAWERDRTRESARACAGDIMRSSGLIPSRVESRSRRRAPL